jgi:hypothetical protein
LNCGSRWLDLDATETSNGNTPLHLICQGAEDKNIIKLLLNSGCHRDCVNKRGKTPLYYVRDKETKALFTSKPTPDYLKCLCARMIADKHLKTDIFGSLTSSLNKFIVLHGSLSVQRNDV